MIRIKVASGYRIKPILSCLFFIVWVSGCGHGGLGFRAGQAMMSIDGEKVDSEEATVPGYIGGHWWMGTKSLKLDLSLCRVQLEDIREQALYGLGLVRYTEQYIELVEKNIRTNNQLGLTPIIPGGVYAEMVVPAELFVDLRMMGFFTSIQYELPRMSLIQPYIGGGMGYWFSVDYALEGQYDTRLRFYQGRAYSTRSYSIDFDDTLSGSGRADKLLAGFFLPAGGPIRLRFEYQRLNSKMDLELEAPAAGMNLPGAPQERYSYPVKFSSHLFLGEILLNLDL